MLANAMIAAFFGGMLSFIMQKSGVAQNMIKQGAELIGDNPLGVAFFSMMLVALVFTTIGGLGAIIMVAIVVLPMLGTVGVPPMVAGGILLFGISMGGVMNAQNWVLYVDVLGLPEKQVRNFALVMFLLMGWMGLLFITLELIRARALVAIHRALMILAVSGGVVAILVFAIATAGGRGEAPLPFFEKTFADRWSVPAEDRAEVSFDEDGIVFEIEVPAGEADAIESVRLLDAEPVANWKNAEAVAQLLPIDSERYASFAFFARSEFPATLHVRLMGTETGEELLHVEKPLEEDKITKVVIPAADLAGIDPADAGQVRLSLTDVRPPQTIEEESNGRSPMLRLMQARYELVETTPLFLTALRIIFAIGIVLVLGAIFLDVMSRVKYWRKQIVAVKWYAYLIPVFPLVLILVYGVPILAAFFIGFAFAVFATLRPGSISMTVQSMIQGASSVLPAVLLMVGIGILVRSVLGPAGYSAAHDGEAWPVIASMQPILKAIIPTTPVLYALVFGIAAPLALYRGPLNIWGLGFGVAALLLQAGDLPIAAIMAMLLSVGQVQGICDPTNTHNVWIANELRVDVQGLMIKTLPYVWGMVFVALGIAAFKYF